MDDEARDTIERFHEALNRRDLDALGDLITDDCVFEATSPAPNGTRHVGRHAVLEACRDFFAGSPTTHFEVEEMFGAGDRVIVRWLYSWADGHVRGVDLLRVRAGRVAETLAYVKGLGQNKCSPTRSPRSPASRVCGRVTPGAARPW